MKQMILTAMATEQSFTSPEPRFYLVFNDGELKVPVSQEAAEIVIKEMYGADGSAPEVETDKEEETVSTNGHHRWESDEDEETGIGQI